MPTPTDRFGLDTYDAGESWDHTDTVQFLDESAIEVDTIANRPTDGSYDGELFFATDQRILYQWDAGGSSWDVELGLGVDGTPVPGTSYFEALEADSLNSADLANADSGLFLETQGDGTLSATSLSLGLGWEEDGNSPSTFTNTSSATYNLSGSYDLVLVFARISDDRTGNLSVELRLNNDNDSNYNFVTLDGVETTGDNTAGKVAQDDSDDAIIHTSFQVSGRFGNECVVSQPTTSASHEFPDSIIQSSTNNNINSPLTDIELFPADGTVNEIVFEVYGRDIA